MEITENLIINLIIGIIGTPSIIIILKCQPIKKRAEKSGLHNSVKRVQKHSIDDSHFDPCVVKADVITSAITSTNITAAADNITSTTADDNNYGDYGDYGDDDKYGDNDEEEENNYRDGEKDDYRGGEKNNYRETKIPSNEMITLLGIIMIIAVIVIAADFFANCLRCRDKVKDEKEYKNCKDEKGNKDYKGEKEVDEDCKGEKEDYKFKPRKFNIDI